MKMKKLNKKYNETIQKIMNFDNVTGKSMKKLNLKWPKIKILIIGGSGSGTTNALLNLINRLPDIDNLNLFEKDPYEVKYQLLINKSESVVLEH